MNILVMAPHADDEVLGCGGMVARRVSEGHSIHVVIANVFGRELETAKASEILGISRTIVLPQSTNMREIVTALDEILSREYYEEVYFPYPSHHQDHQLMYRAAYAALRVSSNEAPRVSALYEYTHIGWVPNPVQGGKMYVDIVDYLDTKIRAFEAYESQMRPFPHPGSPEAIRTLATMRGIECGISAAEVFYLQRMVL